MFVACRLAGLSALEAYYAGMDAHAQMLDRLARPGESYSDVILRIASASA
jgi:hypothetical protein